MILMYLQFYVLSTCRNEEFNYLFNQFNNTVIKTKTFGLYEFLILN